MIHTVVCFFFLVCALLLLSSSLLLPRSPRVRDELFSAVMGLYLSLFILPPRPATLTHPLSLRTRAALPAQSAQDAPRL